MNKHELELIKILFQRHDDSDKKFMKKFKKTIASYESELTKLDQMVANQSKLIEELSKSPEVNQLGYMSHIGNVEDDDGFDGDDTNDNVRDNSNTVKLGFKKG